MTEIYCRFDDPLSIALAAREDDAELGVHNMIGAIVMVTAPIVYWWWRRRATPLGR